MGDFGLGFAWRDKLPEIRRRINCEAIHLILGNHDHLIEESESLFKKYRLDMAYSDQPLEELSYYQKFLNARKIVQLFRSIKYMNFGKIGGHSMCLSHYAMKIWPWSHHGSYHLYGHSHSNLPDDPNSLSMDVGVDTCLFGHTKYEPYSWEEIDHIMKNHKKDLIFHDHHKPSIN